MYILGIETTGPLGSAALADEHGNTEMLLTSEPMSHLREISSNIDRLIKSAGISPKDITAVAASIGPGSFTGIRIGVTTARTYAQALGIKCIPVSSLEVFRQRCSEDNKVAAIFNARRGQVYGALFANDGSDILEPGAYMLDDVKHAAEGFDDVVWYGDGTDAYAELLDGSKTAPESERYQTAEMVCRAAFDKYKEGKLVSYEELMPDYMRAAEAEQKLKDGTLAKMRAAKMARFLTK